MTAEESSLRREISGVLQRGVATGEDSMLMLDINGIIVGYLVDVFDRTGCGVARWTEACEHASLLTDMIMSYLEESDAGE